MLRLLEFSSRAGPGQPWYRPSWRWRAFNAEKSGGSLQLGAGDWMGEKGVIFHWWWWWMVVECFFYRSFMFFSLLLVIQWDCWSDWRWFTGIERWGKIMVYRYGQANMAGKKSMNIRWKHPSHVGLPASRVWMDVNEMSPYRTCHTGIHPQYGCGNQGKDDIITIAFGFWQHIESLSFAKQM